MSEMEVQAMSAKDLTLGESLRIARQRVRMSQDAVAAAVGVSRPTYGHWERDRSEPSINEFRRIVDATGQTWLWQVIDARLTLCSQRHKRATLRAIDGTGNRSQASNRPLVSLVTTS